MVSGYCSMHCLLPLPWFPTCKKKSAQWRPSFNLWFKVILIWNFNYEASHDGWVIDVLAPFLAFVETYSPLKAHKMMAIMFDPRHKNMKMIKEYVGDSFASIIVEEYD
jgi:hypothetical protein